tara:strand:+ start:1910 stop:2368 length:459 start_codon:yes stop_codon:yes gene_type:complete
MKNVKKLIKADKRHEILLAVVFVIYIILNVKTPPPLAQFIDSPLGYIIVAVVALSIFGSTNFVVGILAFIVAYELIRRSNAASNSVVKKYVPSENKKVMDFSKYNDFPVTLEEEVVAKMAPLVKHDSSSNINYKPILDNTHDAASINYQGVI